MSKRKKPTNRSPVDGGQTVTKQELSIKALQAEDSNIKGVILSDGSKLMGVTQVRVSEHPTLGSVLQLVVAAPGLQILQEGTAPERIRSDNPMGPPSKPMVVLTDRLGRPL